MNRNLDLRLFVAGMLSLAGVAGLICYPGLPGTITSVGIILIGILLGFIFHRDDKLKKAQQRTIESYRQQIQIFHQILDERTEVSNNGWAAGASIPGDS